MDIPKELEKWSWIAGIIGAAVALVTLTWQIRAASRKTSRRGEWETMDRAFQGVRIGAPIASLRKLGLNPTARSGSGAVKMTKWELANGNYLSVTYDSVQDRILYMEIDWNQKSTGMSPGISDFIFGRSTLKQIRRRYGSNGFSYAKHMMFSLEDCLVTFNAFELKQTPTIVAVFITKLPHESKRVIDTLPDEKQMMGVIGEYSKLDAIAVADESYLDEIWGKEKLYDPKSYPIEL